MKSCEREPSKTTVVFFAGVWTGVVLMNFMFIVSMLLASGAWRWLI